MNLFSNEKMLRKQKSYKQTLLIAKLSFMMLFFVSAKLFAYTNSSLNAPAPIIVKGVVTDNSGSIPGVSIIVKGTGKGTVTDIDGNYSVSIPDASYTIVFSSIGYKTQEVKFNGKTNINIFLEEDTKKLDEVVVVGYAVQKKESVVGAISQVKGSDLLKAGVPSVANALTGRVPGMVTIQQSGIPGGADSKIYIRGLSSFTGNNQPLVLVDGIERSMSDIDPSEIESVSVLKDASATAVYGVKGGNGVILITTKRGQEGRMSISATYEHTLKAPVNIGFQENSFNTLSARDKYYRNQGQFDKVLGNDILEHYRIQDMPYIYPDVDQWKYNIKPFTTDTRASVSASGGTQNTKYFISLGLLHEGDMLKSTATLYDADYKYDRANFRMNFDFDLTKTTRFSISSSGYVGNQSYGGNSANSDNGGIVNGAYTAPPYSTPIIYPASLLEARYLADGVTLAPGSYPDFNNPIIEDRWANNLISPDAIPTAYRHNGKGTSRTTRDRLATDIVLNQKLDFITQGLSFKVLFSYNNETAWTGGGYNYAAQLYTLSLIGDKGDYVWERKDNYAITAPPYQTSISRSSSAYNYVYSGQFNYARSFGKNNVSALTLVERRISQGNANFPHFEEKWSSRVAYDYDGKYLLEANIGISGSEQFAPANRFGYFPAVAMGWNAAKETFVKNLIPVMDNCKFRYSYGESGNDNTGSQWLYISEYQNWSNVYLGIPGSTNKNVLTVKEGSVPNYEARWERAKKHNLGIDLGFFNNALTLSTEFYSEFRDGILMSRNSVASWFGQSMLAQNIGETKRHGYEIEMGYNNTYRGLHYWFKGNYNFNENRIVNQDNPLLTPDYLRSEGKPIGATFSSVNIGYYNNPDEIANYSLNQSSLKTIGNDMILDFNGDGVLDGKDNVPYGFSNRPNKTYSFSAGFEYKQFDFNFLFQGQTEVQRNFGLWSNPMLANNGEADIQKILIIGRNDIWTPTNTAADYGAWGSWNPANKGIFDASYLRLKSMEIGYTLTGKTLKAIGLSSARISLNGSNIWTYAPGIIMGDPENETNGENGNNFMFQSYPIPKRFTASLKVNF